MQEADLVKRIREIVREELESHPSPSEKRAHVKLFHGVHKTARNPLIGSPIEVVKDVFSHLLKTKPSDTDNQYFPLRALDKLYELPHTFDFRVGLLYYLGILDGDFTGEHDIVSWDQRRKHVNGLRIVCFKSERLARVQAQLKQGSVEPLYPDFQHQWAMSTLLDSQMVEDLKKVLGG